jgi:hypothetical protein
MIRRTALAILLGGLTTAFAADEALPKAETILDRYVEVTGGKEAYQKRHTEIATGTVEFAAAGLKGTVTRYSAEPDKNYSTLEIEGVGKIEMGVTGGVAWEKSAMMGARVKSGEEKAQAVRESTMNAPLVWRKLYSKAVTEGVEPVSGEDCYKVVVTPAEGKPETMYFEKKSGLLVKVNTVAVNQMGEIPVDISVSDYRDFSGILTPTKTVQKAGGQEFSITLQSVKVNEEIPADRFEPPAEVKALVDKSAPRAEKK